MPTEELAARKAEYDTSTEAFVLRQALESEPGLIEAHYNLGRSLLKLARYPAAAAAFATASGIKTDSVPARFNHAYALQKSGRYEEAIDELNKLRELLPRLTDRIAMLEGDYRMEMGPDELACRAYDEAGASPLSSLSARARIAEVRCLLTIDDPTAEKALESLLRRYPRLPQAIELKLIRAEKLANADRGYDAGHGRADMALVSGIGLGAGGLAGGRGAVLDADGAWLAVEFEEDDAVAVFVGCPDIDQFDEKGFSLHIADI